MMSIMCAYIRKVEKVTWKYWKIQKSDSMRIKYCGLFVMNKNVWVMGLKKVKRLTNVQYGQPKRVQSLEQNIKCWWRGTHLSNRTGGTSQRWVGFTGCRVALTWMVVFFFYFTPNISLRKGSRPFVFAAYLCASVLMKTRWKRCKSWGERMAVAEMKAGESGKRNVAIWAMWLMYGAISCASWKISPRKQRGYGWGGVRRLSRMLCTMRCA